MPAPSTAGAASRRYVATNGYEEETVFRLAFILDDVQSARETIRQIDQTVALTWTVPLSLSRSLIRVSVAVAT
jgi:hypothetical protein